METEAYRYCFEASLDINEVRATVMLAVLATESLHGESRVQLESRHVFSLKERECQIEAAGEIGRDLNRLLVGFLRREFGETGFQVERIDTEVAPAAA